MESNRPEKKDEVESDSSGDESLFSQESVYRQAGDQEVQQAISQMSDADFQRYETFRGSNFPKATVKKLINNIIGQAVNPNIVIGVGGLCKVFVGEMVEEAKAVQKELGEDGPLLPSHMHEAHRRMYSRVPNMKVFKRAPWD